MSFIVFTIVSGAAAVVIKKLAATSKAKGWTRMQVSASSKRKDEIIPREVETRRKENSFKSVQ